MTITPLSTLVSVLVCVAVTVAADAAYAQCGGDHSPVTISAFKVIHHKAAGDENVNVGYARTGLAVDFYLAWNTGDHPAGEGHNVTITYYYGDGSNGSSPSHIYWTGGTKNVTVTVSCTNDGDTKADVVVDEVTVHVITGLEITHVGGEAVGANPRMSFNDVNSATARVLPVGTPGSHLIDWIIAVTGTGEACAYAKDGATKDVDLPSASFATSNIEWISDSTLYASIDGDWTSSVSGFDEDEELLHGAVAYLATSVASVKKFCLLSRICGRRAGPVELQARDTTPLLSLETSESRTLF